MVRAARLPDPAGDAAFSIVSIPPAVLADNERLDEALATVPGFSLYRRTSSLGANPTTQGVSLRGIAGSGASRALVTLDGVPQNDPFGGWVICTGLPAEAIASAHRRARRAGSGPYGAGALDRRRRPGRSRTAVPRRRRRRPRGRAPSATAAPPGAPSVSTQGGGARLSWTPPARHSDGWIRPCARAAGAADTRLDPARLERGGARWRAHAGPRRPSPNASAPIEEDRGAGTLYAGSRARMARRAA